METNQSQGSNYYRIKTEWTKELADGNLSKVKTEDLVYAVSYSQAEMLAYAIAEREKRTQFSEMNIEILKTKISDVLFNNILQRDEDLVNGFVCNYFEEDDKNGVGLYSVKVLFISIDERTGKEKKRTETLYTPAYSNVDATQKVNDYLHNNSLEDFIIRDTKFDNAESIYCEPEILNGKTTNI